jgi:hypothetical protein
MIATACPQAGAAWQVHLEPGSARALAAVGDDVVAVGRLAGRFGAVRLSAADGAERWRSTVTDLADAPSVAVDGAGDLVVVAVGDAQGPALVKLSGATGAVLWRRSLGVETLGALAPLVRSDGTVVLALAVYAVDPTDPWEMVVVGLSAAGDVELWRHTVPATTPSSVRLDPVGDVIATGVVWPGNHHVVLKLDGSDGAPAWDRDLAGVGRTATATAAVQPSGDVFVGIRVAPAGFTAHRLAGATGALQWSVGEQTTVLAVEGIGVAVADGDAYVADRGVLVRLRFADGTTRWRGEAGGELIAIDATGDVTTAGWSGPPAVQVVRVAGADGATRWRHALPGRTVNALVARPDVAVVAGEESGRFTVLGLAGATGGLGVCGDGVVDPDEECDEGEPTGADCCDASCRRVADGGACDDGSACTTGDACRTGACVGARIACEPCGSCDAALGCVPVVSACREPTASLQARIDLRRAARVRDDRLRWRWGSGAATDVPDFGDPRTTTDYTLCVYADGALLLRADAPAGRCGRRPCWRRTRRGFRYRADGEGLSAVTLRAGGPGAARVTVQGRGAALGVPVLPLTQAVVVQLKRGDAPICWSAEHGREDTNRAHVFVARGD